MSEVFPNSHKLCNILKGLCWKQHLLNLIVLGKSDIQKEIKLYLCHKISFSSDFSEWHQQSLIEHLLYTQEIASLSIYCLIDTKCFP